MPVLETIGFEVSRGRTVVIRDLSMALPAGRITALLGPNGSGKTTAMLGLLDLLPSRGIRRIFDHTRLAAGDRASIGFVPQEGGIPTGATGPEWIRLQAALRGAHSSETDALLSLLDVPRDRRLARRLSGGERRRVALASALVGNPRLLVLDEPTAGLDPHLRAVAVQSIRSAAAAGAAVLLSTHLLDEIVECAHHVLLIQNGRLIREGSPTTLFGHQSSMSTAAEQARMLKDLFGGPE